MTHKTEGQVGISGLLYGCIGFALALTFEQLGFFKNIETSLLNLLEHQLMSEGIITALSFGLVTVISATLCITLALAVLDTPGVWRRVLISSTTIILIIALIPTLAVWKIYFSPFLPITGVFWTSFCTIIYASHHDMPCDQRNQSTIEKEPVTHG